MITTILFDEKVGNKETIIDVTKFDLSLTHLWISKMEVDHCRKINTNQIYEYTHCKSQ